MKKISFLSIILLLLFSKSQNFSPKEKHKLFLTNSPFSKTKKLSKKERKSLGIPPNSYNERFFELTMNPELGYPTLSKKVELQNYLSSISKRNKNVLKDAVLTGKTPGVDSSNPWISIGPDDVGGRTRAALFDLNDTEKDRIIAGGVSGGLWLNEDIDSSSESSWTEVTGVPGNLAVSVIVQEPNNTSVIYAGTGESYTGADALGNGIYKSTDRGANWSMVFGNTSGTVTTTSLSSSQSKVEGYFFVNDMQVWDPTPNDTSNNDEKIIALLGSGGNGDGEKYEFMDLSINGLYVSSNHGTSWSKITMPNNSSSRQDTFNDIEVDPNNNNIWISTTKNLYGDTGGEFYKSTNGSSFSKVTPTYPSINNSKIGRVEFSPSAQASNTFYVLLATTSIPTEAQIFKTTDNFSNLSKLNEPNDADNGISSIDFTRGQSFYDLEVEVDPNNDQIVYVGGIDLFRSTNGGTNWDQISKWSNNSNLNSLNVSIVHADQHGIYFKPGDSNKGVVVNDGGVYYASSFSTASSTTVFTSQEKGFVTTQFYKVAQSPLGASNDIILGGTQDNGTLMLSDQSFTGVATSTELTGGDGGFPYIDQIGSTNYLISNYIYNNSVYLRSLSGVTFSNGFSDMYLSSSNDSDTTDDDEGDFINPGALDSNLDILYVNASKSSTYKIRRFYDLDTNSPNDSYITGLPSSPTSFHVSTYTSTSTTLLVGFQDGKIVKYTNANNDSSIVSATLADYIGSVSDIQFGTSENEIYATFYNYGVSNIFYSSNGGSSWSSKDGNLPDLPVLTILNNPFVVDEVIIGTELGVWETQDFSSSNPTWQQSNNGMTDVRVNDFELIGSSASNSRVLASTYGRGIFVGTFNSDCSSCPTVTLTDTDSDNLVSGSSVVTITATFSEAMASAPTINITGEVSNVAMTASTTADVWIYPWTVSTTTSGLTTATVSGTDLAGNYYAGTTSITFIIDNTAPTVTLTDTDSDNLVSGSSVVTITATFSEAMASAPTINITGEVSNVAMTASSTASVWIYPWTVSTTTSGIVSATVA
ncbi:hypothetical protein N9392_02130, partial [Flavobacteriaceae bacterium]|nr:hypothetical protein [Flavobacteriaceae bacterium]